MVRSRARSLRIAAITLVALVVAACGTSSPAPTVAPAASPGAVESGAPSAAPSASPVADVSAPFEAAYATIKTGVVSVDGTMTVGDIELQLSGSTTFSGPDSQDNLVTTLAGVSTTTEHVKVAGARFIRTGGGPWLVDTLPASSAQLDASFATAAASVTDMGSATLAGWALHKLVPQTQAFDPAVLGLGAGKPTNVKPTITFYATDDGTPAIVTLDMTWTQPAGSATVDGSVSMQFTFTELGKPHQIRAPDHVWSVFTSKRFAYRVAYPDDFDTSKDKFYDYFDGPDYAFVGVGRTARSGLSLNSIVRVITPQLKKSFHTKTVKNEAVTVAGVKGRLLTVSGTDRKKHKVISYDLWLVKGKYAYEIYWYDRAGNEAADRLAFNQVLSTFSFR